MHATLRIIMEEHAALSAVMHTLEQLLKQHQEQGAPPHFDALRAMLFYVDEFAERRHHRKESQCLFPLLRARTPLMRDQLDHLDDEHARGERRIRELEHALLAYEVMGEPRRLAFEQAVTRYTSFYRAHMAMEEADILPLAQRVLNAEDWASLDQAFGSNQDPLVGLAPDAPWAELFRRIVHQVPAPLGLGPAD